MMSDDGDSVLNVTGEVIGRTAETVVGTTESGMVVTATRMHEPDLIADHYASHTDTTPAPDDKVETGCLVPKASLKGKATPQPHLTTRDPIDPRPVGCVRISRSEIAVYPEKDSSFGLDIPEHTEVLDCHTMTRVSVGRVASRYEFGANLSIQHNGQTWRVETWRERAMRLERALHETQEDMRTGSAVVVPRMP